MVEQEVKEILKKYEKKLSQQSATPSSAPSFGGFFSREYSIFRRESLVFSTTLYERACIFAEGIIKTKADPELEAELKESIKVTHLNITPSAALSLASVVMLASFLVAFAVVAISFLLSGIEAVASDPSQLNIGFALTIAICGVLISFPLKKYPVQLATKWRLEASNQMVPCILYVVMYMRNTPNLEHAIRFAGQHIDPPLALDLRKVFWDIETRRFSTIKESLDNYLHTTWRKWNMEFIEAFNLITSSLYESEDAKRMKVLDKALDVMLESTYENMLSYARGIQNPITILHMMGVILPILGLIMLPILGSFLGVKWYHISIVYNIFLPLVVYYFGYRTLIKRPMGYSQTKIMEDTEEYKKNRMLITYSGGEEVLVKPETIAIMVIAAFLLVGFFPIIFHNINSLSGTPEVDVDLGAFGKLLGYVKSETEGYIGPFGLGSALFSLLIPLGFAIGLGTAYKIKSNRLIKIRNETKKLEKEFIGALFQFGNRVENGIPAEMAFGKIASDLGPTPTGKFFMIVDKNIKTLGMNMEEAIFDRKVGAILSFPSSLVQSSMKILIESSRKSPQAVAKSLMTMSDYINKIDKVSERLKDLLAEIVSSMNAQINFITPFIGGIVVGVGTMMVVIISLLATQMAELGGGEGGTAFAGMNAGELMNMFPLEKMIPPFYFQLVVGLYIVEVVIVLSILGNGIENGIDKLEGENSVAKNLMKSPIMYVVIAGITIVVFNSLAQKIAGF